MKKAYFGKLFNLAIISLIPFGTVQLAGAPEVNKKVAIIKADDIRRVSDKWDDFFTLSKEKGVKVSAGIVCDTLETNKDGYYQWLRDHDASGMIEFWNHGWDHKRWETEDGTLLREFSGTGYPHQKKHFEDSQMAIKRVLGEFPIAFGAPYNAIDSDTERVLLENQSIRILFSYKPEPHAGKLLARMRLRGEHDGTGKPNFEAFSKEYEEKKDSVSFTSIQFHPGAFKEGHLEEYGKIIDLLIEEGWTFVLPREYIALSAQSSFLK